MEIAGVLLEWMPAAAEARRPSCEPVPLSTPKI